MKVTVQTRWYFEEWSRTAWVSAFYGYYLDRDKATELMEKRKKEAPKAKLRLVCQVNKTRSYRNRNSP